jgi:pterin-4a-carbinolamine dehydratase
MNMKKLALLFAVVATTTMANTEVETIVKTINNVKVSIADNSVRVTLDNKHIFSHDCRDFTCKLFTPLLPDPYIEREDGYIVESAVIKQVSLENASSFKRFDNTIVFIVNKASVSGLYSHIGHYAINTNTGSVTVNINEQDVYKNGLPDQKKTVAQAMTNVIF